MAILLRLGRLEVNPCTKKRQNRLMEGEVTDGFG